MITTAVPAGEARRRSSSSTCAIGRGTAPPGCSSWPSGTGWAWPRRRATPCASRRARRYESPGPGRSRSSAGRGAAGGHAVHRGRARRRGRGGGDRREQLGAEGDALRAYEQVEWTRAEQEHWLPAGATRARSRRRDRRRRRCTPRCGRRRRSPSWPSRRCAPGPRHRRRDVLPALAVRALVRGRPCPRFPPPAVGPRLRRAVRHVVRLNPKSTLITRADRGASGYFPPARSMKRSGDRVPTHDRGRRPDESHGDLLRSAARAHRQVRPWLDSVGLHHEHGCRCVDEASQTAFTQIPSTATSSVSPTVKRVHGALRGGIVHVLAGERAGRGRRDIHDRSAHPPWLSTCAAPLPRGSNQPHSCSGSGGDDPRRARRRKIAVERAGVVQPTREAGRGAGRPSWAVGRRRRRGRRRPGRQRRDRRARRCRGPRRGPRPS